MYVSGEGEFGVQTVHDASMDPPVPTWYLPVPQAVHDASPDPPLPTRYLPATQSGRRWEWDGEESSMYACCVLTVVCIVIHLYRLRGVTEALLTSVSGSGFRSGNRRTGTGGPICVPFPLGSHKSEAG
jgi:hypothetical protein